jgi:hypothetical protein
LVSLYVYVVSPSQYQILRSKTLCRSCMFFHLTANLLFFDSEKTQNTEQLRPTVCVFRISCRRQRTG